MYLSSKLQKLKGLIGLKDKSKLRFITYDIADYYGSISEDLFRKAVNWAKKPL